MLSNAQFESSIFSFIFLYNQFIYNTKIKAIFTIIEMIVGLYYQNDFNDSIVQFTQQLKKLYHKFSQKLNKK